MIKKKNSTKKQIVVNTITGWLSTGAKLIVAMILVPFLLKHLGKEGYGLIGLITTIIGFTTLADMGLRHALSRELSEKVAKKSVDEFRIYSSTALFLYLIITALFMIIMWVFTPWFVDVFKVGPSLRLQAINLIRYYGSFSLIYSFVNPVFVAGLQSFNKFNIINNIMTLTRIVSGILIIVTISLINYDPLTLWVLISITFLLIKLLINYFFYRKWCYSGKLGVKYISLRNIRSLFTLGGVLYILQIAKTLAVRADSLIVSYFFGPSGIALYFSGARLSKFINPIVMTLSDQITPITTKFHVNDEKNKQQRLLIDGTKYTLYIGLFFSMGIIIFSKWFSRLWLYSTIGDDYLVVAKIMKYWAIANIATYAGAIHWPIALAMKKLKFSLWLYVPSSIFNIALSIYLVGYTSFGISGVLVGTIITEILRRIPSIWYTAKITNIKLFDYIYKGYAFPAILLFVMFLPYVIVKKFITNYTWEGFIISLLLYAILYVGLLVIMERKLIIKLLKKQ